MVCVDHVSCSIRPLEDTESLLQPLDYCQLHGSVFCLCIQKELLDHILFLMFWKTVIWFSTVAAPFYIPTNTAQKFQLSSILNHTSYLLGFIVIVVCSERSHADGCDVVSHFGFDLLYPNVQWCQISFRVLTGPLHTFLKEISNQVLHPFLNRLFIFLLSYRSSLYILDINFFRYMIYKYFLPLHRLPLYSVDHVLWCMEVKASQTLKLWTWLGNKSKVSKHEDKLTTVSPDKVRLRWGWKFRTSWGLGERSVPSQISKGWVMLQRKEIRSFIF